MFTIEFHDSLRVDAAILAEKGARPDVQPEEPVPHRNLGAEISRRMAGTRAPGAANRLTLKQIKVWLRDYLKDREEEGRDDVAHWDLLMADSGPEPGFFVVFVFHPRPRGCEFICGTGDSFQVRSFCEREGPKDADEVIE